jgi:hypothetical protein
MGGDGDNDSNVGPAPLINLSLSAHLRKGGGELVNTSSCALRLAVGEKPTDEKEEDQGPTTELLVEFADRIMVAEKLSEDFTDRSRPLDRGDSSFSCIQCQQDAIASEIKDSVFASFESETDDTSSTTTASKDDVTNSAHVATSKTAISTSCAMGYSITARKSDEAVQVMSMLEPASAERSVLTHNGPRSGVEIAQHLVATLTIPSSPISNSTRNELGESEKKVRTKNPFDSFGEYVVNLFQKTIVYEEELELQQTQRNLQLNTPKLEALAAVEAISGFRNYSDVKRELRASFNETDKDRTKKNERLDHDTPTETKTSKKLWEERWATFFQEKDKVKLNESAIVVSSCYSTCQSLQFCI